MFEAKVVRTTRSGWPRDQLDQAVADLGLGARGARRQHVGAVADQRQHPALAELLEARSSVRLADQRRRIELPVAGVQHLARGVSITSAPASGIEWVTWRKRQPNGPTVKRSPGLSDPDRGPGVDALLGDLAAQHGGR